MSVYVDPLAPYGSNSDWGFGESCHLFADNEEELHEFATQIGLKRKWFQNRIDFPHYDLTKNKRKKAVDKGAKEVDNKFMIAKLRENRAKRIS